MNTDNEYQETDYSLDAQREMIRASLEQIAADVGMALRDAGFNFPVFLTVPNSGVSLASMATPLDPSDVDWQRASEIVCQIMAQKVSCDRLRTRGLACAVANSTVAAADVISD